MTKKPLLITGIIVLAVSFLLGIYMSLISLGVIQTRELKLVVQTKSIEVVYDGNNHELHEYEIVSGSLNKGHHLEVLFHNSQKEAGEVINSATVLILDNKDNDITDNYDLTVEYGVIKVNKRPVTLRSKSAIKYYDRTHLSVYGINVVSGSIVNGHYVQEEYKSLIIEPGSINNDYEVKIYDEDDIDVSQNYDLTLEKGTLTVLKRPIKITSNSSEKVYDGIRLYNENYVTEGEGLLENHNLDVLFYDSIIEPGIIYNTFTVQIYNDQDYLVNEYYEITQQFGTLEILYPNITILSGNAEKYYDGEPLSNENYIITAGGLPSLFRKEVFFISDITEPGTTPNMFYIKVYDLNDNDITHLIDITYKYGELEILRFDISFESRSKTKTYDGEILEAKEAFMSEGSLKEGHRYVVEFLNDLLTPGVIENKFNIRIYDIDDNDVTRYYNIEKEYGTLEIRHISLIFMSTSKTKDYDKEVLIDHQAHLIEGSLKTGHYYEIDYYSELTLPGEIDNLFYITIYDENDNDITSHYYIQKNYGKLTVLKRPITILTGSASKIYDGTPLTKDSYEVLQEDLLDGDELIVRVVGVIIEIGSLYNDAVVLVLDENGKDVTDNYDIRLSLGTLSITSGVFSSGNITKEPIYDEEEHVMLKVYSEKDDTIYLRQISYGDYNKQGFLDGETYVSHDLNPLSFTSWALVTNNYEPINIKINRLEEYIPYLMPYYNFENIYGYNDVIVNKEADSLYDVQYMSYDYFLYPELKINYNYLVQKELEYRNFVYDTYLKLPSSTKTQLLQIASDNGINKNSETLIADIQNYILNVGTYNLNFPIVDGIEDIGIYFLTELKEGFCQHFAAAGTIMFRAMGIPARYVTGFIAETKAYNWVDVTNTEAHAWVEVYIDGLGWINIEVTPGSGSGDSSGNGSGNGDGSGSGNDVSDLAPNDSTGSISGNSGQNMDVPVVEIYTETSDLFYLRHRSYGDFDGISDFLEPEIFNYYEDFINPLQLPSLLLELHGLGKHEIQIRKLEDINMHLTTYYPSDGFYDLFNDVEIKKYLEEYKFDYINYIYNRHDNITAAGTIYEDFELAYRQFVYNKYLYVDQETLTTLLELAQLNDLNHLSPSIITDVQNYILNSATYNLNFSPFDENGNHVIEFLTDKKEGVCRHFAGAAVLMYRAMGIPARYVTGFSSMGVENKWTTVSAKTAHAWVEVYIDGFGWVNIEVTPSSNDDLPNPIVIKPKHNWKIYDGTPVYAEDIINPKELSNLLKQGYTYNVFIGGSQTDVGESISFIEDFILYDPNGNDVTNEFNFIHTTGKINVYIEELKVVTASYTKEYDGIALVNEDDTYYQIIGNLNENHEITEVLFVDSQLFVGSTINSVILTIVDEFGNDVTKNYYIDKKQFGRLEVTPRKITVTSHNRTEYYTGETFTEHSYNIDQIGYFDEVYEVTFTGMQRNIGSSENIIEDIKIYRNGVDVTYNYTIEFVFGILRVLPSPND